MSQPNPSPQGSHKQTQAPAAASIRKNWGKQEDNDLVRAVTQDPEGPKTWAEAATRHNALGGYNRNQDQC